MDLRATWWDRNVLNQLETFRKWIGDHTAPSKVAARNWVISAGYTSILDVGCGTCSEYFGYREDAPNIEYRGVDSCADLVRLADENQVPNVIHGDLEALPMEDNAVDVVFVRHVLEHLDGYKSAVNEAVRVARREVLVIFFLPCTDGEEVLNYDEAENLRHNRYSRQELENHLLCNPKVESIRWEPCGNEELEEEMLHVMLTSSCGQLRRDC